MGSVLLSALPLTLSACETQQLVVRGGVDTLGTTRVDCSLAEPWPGPNSIAVRAVVEEPPCDTGPGVLLHVFRDDVKLSSRRFETPLSTLRKEDERISNPFAHPGSGTVVRVEVHGHCLSSEKDAQGKPVHGEHIWGVDTCRIP